MKNKKYFTIRNNPRFYLNQKTEKKMTNLKGRKNSRILLFAGIHFIQYAQIHIHKGGNIKDTEKIHKNKIKIKKDRRLHCIGHHQIWTNQPTNPRRLHCPIYRKSNSSTLPSLTRPFSVYFVTLSFSSADIYSIVVYVIQTLQHFVHKTPISATEGNVRLRLKIILTFPPIKILSLLIPPSLPSAFFSYFYFMRFHWKWK